MSYLRFNTVKQHLHKQGSQMGAVRTEVILINNAFGPVVLCLARRGQSFIGNAGTKAPLTICCPVPFLHLYFLLTNCVICKSIDMLNRHKKHESCTSETSHPYKMLKNWTLFFLKMTHADSVNPLEAIPSHPPSLPPLTLVHLLIHIMSRQAISLSDRLSCSASDWLKCLLCN